MSADVGTGILAAMANYRDEPMADSIFQNVTNKYGTTYLIERCEGLYATYTASNISGEWKVSVDWKGTPPMPQPPTPSIISMSSPNFWTAPRPVSILAIVIHSMNGTLAGTDTYFAEQSSQVSAHLGIGLDGTIHRYVQDLDVAWSNGILSPGKPWAKLAGVNPSIDPNYYTLSIETEDMGDQNKPVSVAQYAAVLACCRTWMGKYPTIKYLAAHNGITSTICPGARFLATGKLTQLGRDLGLQVVM